jgi:hypothetical protein
MDNNPQFVVKSMTGSAYIKEYDLAHVKTTSALSCAKRFPIHRAAKVADWMNRQPDNPQRWVSDEVKS